MTSMATSLRWLAQSQRWTQRGINLLHALQSGFWLGALSEETLRLADVYPYHEPDVAAAVRRHWGQLTWKDAALQYLPAGGSVLVVGAGGGWEMQALHERGFTVDDIDFCPDLVQAGNEQLAERGVPGRVRCLPRYDLSSLDGKYDGVLVARVFLSNLAYRQQRIELLARLRERLVAGGTLLASVYLRKGNGLDWRLNRALANLVRRLTFRRRPAVELGLHLDPESPLAHHHYLGPELAAEARAAGLTVLSFETDWLGHAILRRE